MTDIPTFLLVSGGIGLTAAGWWARGRAPEWLMGNTSYVDSDRPANMRPLDLVEVTCESPEHEGAGKQVPTILVERRRARQDVRLLQEGRWGGGTRINTCYVHNASGVPLERLHVVCRTPDCPTRDTIRVDHLVGDFGRLASAGWRNTPDEDAALCKYCSGRVRRPRY